MSGSGSSLGKADQGAKASFDDRGVGATEACPQHDQGSETTASSWIEIELIGEDDAPVVGEPYRVTLSDQSVIEGRIGKTGVVRIEGIDPGRCTVSFPALDQEAWDPA
ncbi:MAG: hypothetical protein KDK70_30605 [Myxococcales bacterium]|nr:hypothetical protein [Myxococcales bacterium]